MKRSVLTVCLLFFTGILFKSNAQDEDIMKNYMEYAEIGEMHKLMAQWDGTWSADIKMWMAPGTEAMTNKGTAVNTMIMGGRQQLTKFSGDMMGMPFEGMGLLGFDNHKKMFESIWIDNLSTGTTHLTGSWNAATKTLAMSGKTMDAGTKKVVSIRQVFKIVDNDTQIMEMYIPDPKTGKEFKSMEIKYTRNK